MEHEHVQLCPRHGSVTQRGRQELAGAGTDDKVQRVRGRREASSHRLVLDTHK